MGTCTVYPRLRRKPGVPPGLAFTSRSFPKRAKAGARVSPTDFGSLATTFPSASTTAIDDAN
jgi:hypothetical protein